MTPEPGIEVVFFLLVAGAAEGLQIADVVGTGTPLARGMMWSMVRLVSRLV
jgi:hypothetical protein